MPNFNLADELIQWKEEEGRSYSNGTGLATQIIDFKYRYEKILILFEILIEKGATVDYFRAPYVKTQIAMECSAPKQHHKHRTHMKFAYRDIERARIKIFGTSTQETNEEKEHREKVENSVEPLPAPIVTSNSTATQEPIQVPDNEDVVREDVKFKVMDVEKLSGTDIKVTYDPEMRKFLGYDD